ncbi:MAG: aldo/keto reductase [Deltaproteobacteria bacterium]|nr:aldo/keto reductase [Deltaproteobacteria bacterium]
MDDHITRRRFLQHTACGLAGTAVLGSVLSPGQGWGSPKAEPMLYRPLGKTGLQVSALGYGVMRLTEPAVLFQALDRGINYFDTAHTYQNGNNEKMLGRVLKEHGRKKVFIATKIPPFNRLSGTKILASTASMERKFEESLRRLQTDYVDVLFLHAISDPAWPQNEQLLNFCRRLKQAGKARFVGISCHEAGKTYEQILENAMQAGIYDVFLVTLNFKSPPAHLELLKRVHKAGIGTVAMKTQAGGYAQKSGPGVTAHQAALAWALASGVADCAVPGMTNRRQLQDNAAALSLKISTREHVILHKYAALIQDRFCRRCGECLGTCRSGVAIPDINRALMYREGYSDHDLARNTYNEFSATENASQCLTCTDPSCRCTGDITLPARMRVAHNLLS